MKFNYEYDRKARVGFIGCGGHAFRNLYPCFQYLPADLVAVCSRTKSKAEAFARMFGAERAYTDYREMLARERLDAVFMVLDFDESGRPKYPPFAIDAFRAGCHVWMEKPPAYTVAEVEGMLRVARETGRYAVVGYKRYFFPAFVKAKEIVESEEFGEPTSICGRYGLSLAEWRDGGRDLTKFMDICHPFSAILYLMGSVKSIYFEEERANGGVAVSMKFVSGAVGALHLTAGMSGISPKERFEVIGRGANLVIDNGNKLYYYRPGNLGPYGRAPDFTTSNEMAPLFWEPESSLGQLYNKNIFLQGFVQEMGYFLDCVIENKPPERSNLEDALELTRIFEAFNNPSGRVIEIA
ncbi:MAG: Gfo/Idh/MocA family protein [bacterium]